MGQMFEGLSAAEYWELARDILHSSLVKNHI